MWKQYKGSDSKQMASISRKRCAENRPYKQWMGREACPGCIKYLSKDEDAKFAGVRCETNRVVEAFIFPEFAGKEKKSCENLVKAYLSAPALKEPGTCNPLRHAASESDHSKVTCPIAL